MGIAFSNNFYVSLDKIRAHTTLQVKSDRLLCSTLMASMDSCFTFSTDFSEHSVTQILTQKCLLDTTCITICPVVSLGQFDGCVEYGCNCIYETYRDCYDV